MTSYPTDPEKWLNLPYSYKAVHARQVRWYPGDSYHTLPSSLVDKGDVSLAHAEGDTLDGFMAALPQWDLPVVAGDPSSLPWRLIWTWHPVLEAFGHNKSANSSYSPDPWFYPAELFDNQKDVYKLLPAEIENYQDHVIVYPLYRLIVFHHTSKPRNKMINLLTSKLALPGDSTYFLSLKNRQPGDPLPTIPDWVNETCARKLHNALLALLKQRSPNDTASWKSYAKANNIIVPDRPITLEELHQTSTPPTAADFPTLADTVVPKPPAKAQEFRDSSTGQPPLELFLVFGDGCLHLTTGNNNLASFVLPQRNSTPVPLTNNGWTLSPTTGAYFFAKPSVSVGHLFPSIPATDDPFRFPRPNVVLWPNQTPAINPECRRRSLSAWPHRNAFFQHSSVPHSWPVWLDGCLCPHSPTLLRWASSGLDNIHAAVANLASLLATTNDLTKSPKEWIKAAILPTYAGKGVPGNFDTNTQEIVSNGVLTVASYGVHKPLSENLIAALVAFDNRKHRMRFDWAFYSWSISISSTRHSSLLYLCPSPNWWSQSAIRLLSLYSCTSATSQCTSLRYLFLSCTGQTGHPPRWYTA